MKSLCTKGRHEGKDRAFGNRRIPENEGKKAMFSGNLHLSWPLSRPFLKYNRYNIFHIIT